MKWFFEIATSGLGPFLACLILTTVPICTIANIFNRYWRHKTMQKIGYPPPHCDADGDFKPEQENDES